jgi:hypothetical protein
MGDLAGSFHHPGGFRDILSTTPAHNLVAAGAALEWFWVREMPKLENNASCDTFSSEQGTRSGLLEFAGSTNFRILISFFFISRGLYM